MLLGAMFKKVREFLSFIECSGYSYGTSTVRRLRMCYLYARDSESFIHFLFKSSAISYSHINLQSLHAFSEVPNSRIFHFTEALVHRFTAGPYKSIKIDDRKADR